MVVVVGGMDRGPSGRSIMVIRGKRRLLAAGETERAAAAAAAAAGELDICIRWLNSRSRAAATAADVACLCRAGLLA